MHGPTCIVWANLTTFSLKFLYSDLSMITMMFVVGTVVREHGLVRPGAVLQCRFRKYRRTKYFSEYSLKWLSGSLKR